MALREYKCACGVLTEKIIFGTNDIPQVIPCPKCGAEAAYLAIPTSISLGRSTFSEAPIDVMIGKDSDRRWEDINKRQEVRDKVRKETGSQGLSMTGRGEFTPVTEDTKAKRAESVEVLSQSGHKQTFDSPADQKILGA
jgi:hypothetical protein